MLMPNDNSKSVEATQARKQYRRLRLEAIAESVRGAAIFRVIKRSQRQAADKAETKSKHDARKLNPKGKADTPNTTLAKEFATDLVVTTNYQQNDYEGVTLYSLLPVRTQSFITTGVGVVSTARVDLESIVECNNYPDYKVISSIIYASYKRLETARATDKQHRVVHFNYSEYLEMISTLVLEATTESNKFKAVVALMAITGCRSSELTVLWYSVDNRFIRFDSPKVSGLSTNLVPLVGADLATVKQLRADRKSVV